MRRHILVVKTSSDKKGRSAKKIQKRKKDKEGGMAEKSASAFPANLNYGTVGERVYLCY